MTVLTDIEIRSRCVYFAPDQTWQSIVTPMISPFVMDNVNKIDTTFIGEGAPPLQVTERVVSFGLSSFGYDARLAPAYKLFTPVTGGPTIIDPKNIDERCFQNFTGDSIVMPPHSFMLGHTVEYFRIPDDVMVVCLGKSTYARCGLIVNVTPLEPGWEGQVTIEISNTTPLPAKIYGNEGIAQFLFFKGSNRPSVTYADRNGKYQGQLGVTPARI